VRRRVPFLLAGVVALGLAAADVKTVTGPPFNAGGDAATLTVVPASKPGSARTEDLVHVIRGHSGEFERTTGAVVLVTGTTAMDIDVSQRLNDALLPYLALWWWDSPSCC
jgi:RND superfamily putative drug exporter